MLKFIDKYTWINIGVTAMQSANFMLALNYASHNSTIIYAGIVLGFLVGVTFSMLLHCYLDNKKGNN